MTGHNSWAMHKANKDRDAEIVALVKAGNRKSVLARQFNLSKHRIAAICDREEIRRRGLLAFLADKADKVALKKVW